jgi:hypothetical protein
MYLRQAGLTRNPTFSYLYCVRCRGQDAASKAPLERKYSRYAPGARPVTVDGRGRRHNVWLRRPVCRQADGELKIKKHLDNKYFPRTGRGRFTTSLLLDTAQRTP